jgi:hypothetical protein
MPCKPGEEQVVPTGRWCVTQEEASFWGHITPPELAEEIKQRGRCAMPKSLYEHLGLHEIVGTEQGGTGGHADG